MEGLRKSHENFSQDSLCSGWESNRVSPDYKFNSVTSTLDGAMVE